MNIIQSSPPVSLQAKLIQEMNKDLSGPQYLNEKGGNRLHEAVMANRIEDIKKWCTDYPYLIEMSDSEGNFPIHFVQSLEGLQILLRAGAKWGPQNGKGQSVWNIMIQLSKTSPKTFTFSCLKEMIKTDEFFAMDGFDDRINHLENFLITDRAEKIFWPNLREIIPLLIEKRLFWQPHDRNTTTFRNFQNFITSKSFIENFQNGKIPNADSLPNPLLIAILTTHGSSFDRLVEKGYTFSNFDYFFSRIQDEKLARFLAAFHETTTEREKVELLRKACCRLEDLKKPSPQQMSEVKNLLGKIHNIAKYITEFDRLIKFIHKWNDLWPQEEHKEIAFHLVNNEFFHHENYLIWFISQAKPEFIENLRLRIIQYKKKRINANSFAEKKVLYLRACCSSNIVLMVQSIIEAIPFDKYFASCFLIRLSQDEIIEFQRQIYFIDNPSEKILRLRHKLLQ